MLEKKNRKYFVLIVDDSEEDSFFVERALRQSALFEVVGSVTDGKEAIAYLSGHGQYADRQLWPFPDVLLVDLKIPEAGALEVLEWMKVRKFEGLNAVILSGSSAAVDIQEMKRLGAAAFNAKSPDRPKLLKLIEDIEKLLLHAGPHG